jgi:hypothetical protein
MGEFLNSPLGVVLWMMGGMLPWWLVAWRSMRRDRRHWQQKAAEDARQWALQRQLWDLEQQIWDEQLSEEEHERRRQAQARVAEVRREARQRLGLPEEGP